MRIGIALAAAVAALAVHPAAAQSRGAQLTTGLSLASLGTYAAFADRDCSQHRWTVLQNGRCEWRTLGGRYVGVPADLPRRQMAVGLAVAAVGGLMAGGAWEPSRALDALATAGAGVMLLAVARNENHTPGTVHIEGDDGWWYTQCPQDMGTYGASYDPSGAGYDLPECRHTSFNRLNAMWGGVAALGLAVGRWLWRDEPKLNVEVQPGAFAVSKTIEF